MERYDPDEGPINAVIRGGILAYRGGEGSTVATEHRRNNVVVTAADNNIARYF